MTKELDLTKPLQTKRGEKAEFVYDGVTGGWPLVAVVHLNSGTKTLRAYTREGVYNIDEASLDNLINVQ